MRLTFSQRGQASEVLTRAFQEDVTIKYIFPDNRERARSLRRLFGVVVRYCLLYGEVHTTSSVEGIACWLRPGHGELSPVGVVRTGMLGLPMRVGWRALRRFREIYSCAARMHEVAVSEPHWYLWALGVEPGRQGRGIGRSLLEAVHVRADAGGVACYLETEDERNIAFYCRHGYEVVEKGEATREGIRIWGMLRRPIGTDRIS